MSSRFLVFLALLLQCSVVVFATPAPPQKAPPSQLFSPLIPQKVLATFQRLPNPIQYPQWTDRTNGLWALFNPDTWTSGFFPATLYALNTRKQLCGTSNGIGAADWVALGRSASAGLIPLTVRNGVGHDTGFLSFPFVEELALNPNNQTAIKAINDFARLLANRYSPTVGCTRSWDSSNPENFQVCTAYLHTTLAVLTFTEVIIDNLMNLEVLYLSAKLTGNNTLIEIANKHADTTILNHIRPDGGTWHVIEYNATTGGVIRKRTAQGYADSSTWSRGQAWGLYGYANMYRLAKFSRYLDTARRLANFFLVNIPADGIVPWDFNAPLNPAPRPADSAAATIAANGLLLLSQYETNANNARRYRDAAIKILNDITTLAWNPSWQSLLSNGTVHWPANNYLTGTVYGDYYYITAGNTLVQQGLAQCP
ncbi:hypothetical protein AX16_004252 [Volvariella volvacea WC 439]|nr:hypothetical protein AX16_004252 [Volvariella volvacea WC 439]